MKIALIVWNGRIAPVFDTAPEAVVIETEGRKQIGRKVLPLPEDDPQEKLLTLIRADVSVLICGAISNPFRGQAAVYGMTVHPFLSGELENVIQAYLNGELETAIPPLPGCGRRRGRGWGNGGRGNGGRGNGGGRGNPYRN